MNHCIDYICLVTILQRQQLWLNKNVLVYTLHERKYIAIDLTFIHLSLKCPMKEEILTRQYNINWKSTLSRFADVANAEL